MTNKGGHIIKFKTFWFGSRIFIATHNVDT